MVTKMDLKRIEAEMHKFEKIIGYTFKDINNLAFAMRSSRIHIDGEGEDHKEYSNEGLATVGDTILKFVISDNLYQKGITTKSAITDTKKDIESNDTMHRLMLGENWIKYSYNDLYFLMDNPPQHEQVVNKKHNAYLEAIVAAIYYDSNFETIKNWIINTLLPLLEKYKQNN